jgi:hypothetical protein
MKKKSKKKVFWWLTAIAIITFAVSLVTLLNSVDPTIARNALLAMIGSLAFGTVSAVAISLHQRPHQRS